MARALLAVLVVFAVLTGWILVQRLYARFAARHPELGPFRAEGGGGGCACGQGASCARRG